MNFRHPVFLTLLVAAICVLIGLYFIERQRAVVPSGDSMTWGRIGAYLEPQNPATTPDSSRIPEPLVDVGEDSPPVPVTASNPQPQKPPQKTAAADGSFDYNALLAQLRHDSTAPAQQANKTFTQLLDAFSFAPVIATPEEKVKTPEQQALFEYGNDIGLRLKGFAALNSNMAQILSDQIAHRTDPSKGNPLRDLGNRYVTLGESILAIHDIPPAVESAHYKLGESYVQLGRALSRVPDATEDQAFLAAITAYNNKADAYTNAFVGMVTLFSTLEVRFEESDGGSVFSFRRN